MKLFLLGVLLLNASFAVGNSDLEIQHFSEEIAVPAGFNEKAIQFDSTWSPSRDGELLVEIEQIINIGKKIWKIIEANQPVLNVKYQYANALPKGIKTSEDLEGFSNLNTRGFHVWGTNLYGVRVYDLEYVAVHRHGGSYQGAGRYVENATVLPQHVEVAWGYTMNYGVTNVSTVNVGTKENPIASLLLETELSVSTVLKKSQSRQVFEFRGDSGQVRVTGK